MRGDEPRAASAAEAREDRRRVKELERQLHRKDKAQQAWANEARLAEVEVKSGVKSG